MKGLYLSFLPLYSIRAHGQFYGVYPFGYLYPNDQNLMGYKIYQTLPTAHGTTQYARRKVVQYDPHSVNQQYWRGWMASGVKQWQGLTAQGKQIYNAYKYPVQCSGYNKFLSIYLKTKRK